MQVIKRNLSLEEFDKEKIYKAVMKAAIATDQQDFDYEARAIADDIEKMLKESGEEKVDIEQIQDLIEIDLYAIAEAPETAKAFILFREKRKQERDKANRYANMIRSRALAPDEANAKANANLDENSFTGRMYEANEALWKETALEEFMPKEIADLHRKAMLYQHDLSRFAIGQHNCLTVYFDYIWEHGFQTRQATLRPPSRFSTACQQVAVIFQVLSQHQFGGIASGHIDRDLARFVAMSREKLTNKYKHCGLPYNIAMELVQKDLEDEVHQGCEALIHNLATLQSRPGAQLPFSSLNLGLDTSEEGRMVSKGILEAMIEGVGPHHQTPPFPILCFQVKKGVNKNPEDPNYDLKMLAIECAARRLTPNFVNCDSSVCHENPNDPDTELTAMGCRTQMGRDIYSEGDPYNRVGRGNLAPVTIIPVELGLKYGIATGKREKPDLEGFEHAFDYMLKKAEESLLIRANLIFKQKMKVAYEMYVNHVWKATYDYDDEASVYDVLKHGTLVIGMLGWAETLTALFGKHHGESKEAEEFLLKMEKKAQQFAADCTERNKLNFALYHTPAENLCYTAMQKLQERWGKEIKGVTDHEYVTNSIHVPVWYDIDVFDKLKEEAKFSKLATGGNIVYVEFDSTAVHNLKAVEQVIDFAMDQDIPYFAFNFPLDECTVCGYSGEIPAGGCPECGAPDEAINRLRRVTGYITSDYRRAFNAGKQAEVESRVVHTHGKEVKLKV